MLKNSKYEEDYLMYFISNLQEFDMWTMFIIADKYSRWDNKD
jgi:hypothetical protein